MKILKYLALALAISLSSLPMKAQEESKQKDIPVDFKLQLKNMHLWRGLQVTNSAVAATDISVSTKNKMFTFGLWGGAGIDGKYKEFDYYASFQHKGFKLAVWDIYNFSDGAAYPTGKTDLEGKVIPKELKLFNYRGRETAHFVDVSLSYTFQGNFPLTLGWSTIVHGRDRGEMNKKNFYSSYVSASYPVLRDKFIDLELGIAGAFALDGEKGTSANFYAKSAGIVNVNFVASKNIVIGSYTLPVSVMGMWNPANSDGNIQVALDLITF